MPRYEAFSAPEINTILEWVGDRTIISLMIGQSPEGNHAPFFTVVVEVDKQSIQWNEDTGVPVVEFEPPKKKGGRPKGWKKGESYAGR